MEEKKVFTKDEIAANFASPKVEVVFEKKDGSIRKMICTRNFDTIPEEMRPADKEGKPQIKPSPDHLFPVFDLESNGWRSFTIANVISVTPL